MTPSFAIEFFLVGLFSLFSAPMPFGVPPMPEDPRIAQAAPADTILFIQWFGEGAPMPQFPNDAAKFGSQPQIRGSADAIIAAVAKLAKDNAEGADPEELEALTAWAMGLARRPGCAFVTRLDAEQLRRGPKAASLGLVVNVKNDVATAKKRMEFLHDWMQSTAFRFDGGGAGYDEPIRTADDVEFRPFKSPKNGPMLSWGIVDGYLAIGFGDNFPQEVTDGLRKGPGLFGHKGFSDALGRVRVASPCWRTFADLDYLFGEMGKQSPEVAGVLQATGLSDAKVLVSESGLLANHYVSHMFLPVEKRRGVLALFDGGDPTTEDLGKEDLKALPRDVDAGFVVRIKPEIVFGRILESLGDPELAKDVKQKAKGAVQAFLGFDLEKDILTALGDRIAIYSRPVPQEGAPPFAGTTLTWSLRDPAKIRKVHDRLIDTLYRLQDAQRDPDPDMPQLEEKQVGDVTVYSAKLPAPIRPAWCIKDDHLVLSIAEPGVQDVLKNGVLRESNLGETRLANGIVIQSIAGWINWPTVLPQLYPLAKSGLPTLRQQLSSVGFEIGPEILPPLDALTAHLQADAMSVSTNLAGISIKRTGSLPHLDLGVAAVIGCATAAVFVADM